MQMLYNKGHLGAGWGKNVKQDKGQKDDKPNKRAAGEVKER
jgi:hypothetical protein